MVVVVAITAAVLSLGIVSYHVYFTAIGKSLQGSINGRQPNTATTLAQGLVNLLSSQKAPR